MLLGLWAPWGSIQLLYTTLGETLCSPVDIEFGHGGFWVRAEGLWWDVVDVPTSCQMLHERRARTAIPSDQTKVWNLKTHKRWWKVAWLSWIQSSASIWSGPLTLSTQFSEEDAKGISSLPSWNAAITIAKVEVTYNWSDPHFLDFPANWTGASLPSLHWNA